MISSWIIAIAFMEFLFLFLLKAECHHDKLQPAVLVACFSAAALGSLAIVCWHMAENHCSINACSMCIWQVRCRVCPPVVRLGLDILHPHVISLQVPALYGMATALSRVIGYWADCFACGLFFCPFMVSFFFFFLKAPPPFPLSFYSLACGCAVHMQACRINTHSASHWPFFGADFWDLFFFHWLHTAAKKST